MSSQFCWWQYYLKSPKRQKHIQLQVLQKTEFHILFVTSKETFYDWYYLRDQKLCCHVPLKLVCWYLSLGYIAIVLITTLKGSSNSFLPILDKICLLSNWDNFTFIEIDISMSHSLDHVFNMSTFSLNIWPFLWACC